MEKRDEYKTDGEEPEIRCPFCGEFLTVHIGRGMSDVECANKECGFVNATLTSTDIAEIVEIMNHRPIEDAQALRIKTLEAAMLEATDNCETCRGIEDVERLCARCKTFLEIVFFGQGSKR